MFSLSISDTNKQRITNLMHILVVIVSCLMIAYLTIDTLHNKSFLSDSNYLNLQFWGCLVFLLDLIIEIWFSKKKLSYILRHLFFLLICIPYLNIIHHFDIHLRGEIAYILRFVPMIRAAYVFTIVTGATASAKWVKNLLVTYMIVLIVIVYFCSLTFFVTEQPVNDLVNNYWESLQWSIMSLTTAGCSIHAMTPTGRVLGVVLSALGLIFFPIFTVFLTNSYSEQQEQNPKKGD